MKVILHNAGDYSIVATTTTLGGGLYLFDGLHAGAYKVEVDTSSPALAGFVPSPTLQGGDTTVDSNNNPSPVSLATDDSEDLTIDFGYNNVGRIIVVKKTVPAGSGQVFIFTSNYSGPFNMTDGGSNDTSSASWWPW